MDIGKVKLLLEEEKIQWTNHVLVRLLQRGITQKEIENALLNGEIIEEYENDYPYPSCLVCGLNAQSEILHIVCGLAQQKLWIITAYYPDNIKWKEDFKTRREKSEE